MKKFKKTLCGLMLSGLIAISGTVCFATGNGDVNNDGLRNANDLILLRKMLIGTEDSLPEGNVNNDSTLDIRDLVHLKKLISISDGYWVEGTDQGHDDIFN